MDLKQEVQTRYILHWNYREYPQFPQELLTYGRNIEQIYYKENDLQEIPEDFALKLPKLSQLYLYGNKLTSLPNSIGQLANLQILDLAHNNLVELPESIGDLKSLNTLDISHNKIQALPESIGKLHELIALIAVKNQLSNLPKSIRNLINLQSLHLNGNMLKSIPPELCKCEFLKDLYLEGNQIQKLPNELTILRYLTHVNLAKNDLQELPTLPFISSEVKINYDENPCINEIPYIFGCQQNHHKTHLALSPYLPHLDPYFWHFKIKGCGDEVPKRKTNNDLTKNIMVLTKSPVSLMEHALKVVYNLTYQKQITFKDEDNLFKRTPRVSTVLGKQILNEYQLPKSIKFMLLKGPQTFCCLCLRPIFEETFQNSSKAPFAYAQDKEILAIYYFCRQSCQNSFFRLYYED